MPLTLAQARTTVLEHLDDDGTRWSTTQVDRAPFEIVGCKGTKGPTMRQDMIRKMGGEYTHVEFPRYAWPGGYEMFFIMDDCGALCVPCANDKSNPVHFKDEDPTEDGWMIMEVDTTEYCEVQMNCDHCNRPLWQDDEPTERNGRG